MADEPEDLTLRRLRDMRKRIDDLRASFDYKLEVVERRLALGATDDAATTEFVTSLERRVRRLEGRADLHGG